MCIVSVIYILLSKLLLDWCSENVFFIFLILYFYFVRQNVVVIQVSINYAQDFLWANLTITSLTSQKNSYNLRNFLSSETSYCPFTWSVVPDPMDTLSLFQHKAKHSSLDHHQTKTIVCGITLSLTNDSFMNLISLFLLQATPARESMKALLI